MIVVFRQVPFACLLVGTVTYHVVAADTSPDSDPVASLQAENARLRQELSELVAICWLGGPELDMPGRKLEDHVQNTSEVEDGEEFKGADAAVAYVFLSMFFFLIMLLYFLNWADPDIRRYSLATLCSSVSLSSAFVIFSGFNACLMSFVEQMEWGNLAAVCFQFGQVILWLCLIRFALPSSENVAVSEVWVVDDPRRHDYEAEVDQNAVRNIVPGAQKSTIVLKGIDVQVALRQVSLHRFKRHTKCFVSFLSTIAGLSAIRAGGMMQNMEVFSASPVVACAPVVVTFCFTLAVFRVAIPKREGHHAAMVEKEMKAAAINTSCFALSFLLVQVIRFQLSGALPDVHGVEVSQDQHQIRAIYGLYALGLFATAVTHLLARSQKGEEENQSFIATSKEALEMTFAWSVFFATRSLWFRTHGLALHSIGGHVSVALLISGAGFFSVLILDMFGDGTTIGLVGILVCFAWGQAFDQSMLANAAFSSSPFASQFAYALFALFIVIPAWRKYILAPLMLSEQAAQPASYEPMSSGT